MKIIKKIQGKIANMSIPGAMLLSGLIVGFSIFFTTWIFFGGDNNRQKLSVKNPALNRTQQSNQLTPQQIQQMQQQRAQQAAQQAAQQQAVTAPVVKTATTTAPKAPVKK